MTIFSNPSRRDFLSFSAAGLGAAVVPQACFAMGGNDRVKFSSDLETLVRKIEETPREKCLDMVAGELKRGLTYRQFLGALFMAGIRNVNPQPPGFKFHCVFVIHAAHQLSLDLGNQDRLLPLMWALDNFKVSQAKDVSEGDFVLKAPRGNLPEGEKAWSEFDAAMNAWDEERADRAIIALYRNQGAHEVIEGLWRYGARDYRNIGHKAIFVANAWRTLQTIGWRHAEPVLRSLVLGLLDFGAKRSVNGFAFADQCFMENQRLASAAGSNIGLQWTRRKGEDQVAEWVKRIRTGDHASVCKDMLAELQSGRLGGDTAWDAVHLAAGELMLRQPGIYGIHTVTSAHALRYAYQTSVNIQTRLLMLLQGVGWMCQFARFMGTKDRTLNDQNILAIAEHDAPVTLDQLFDSIGNPSEAGPLAAAYAKQGGDLQSFWRQARQLIVSKGSDAHDYKYSTSISEDMQFVAPQYRPQMLAVAAHHLRGNNHKDNGVVKRARESAML